MSRLSLPRPRRRVALAALVVATLVATACNPPSNEPDEYNEISRSNFIQGCTGIAREGTALDASTSSIGVGAPENVCVCQYEWFVEEVPFDSEAAEQAGEGPDAVNFVELNQQLGDDPNSMPEDIQNRLQTACPLDGGTTPGTGEAQTGTSVAPADTEAETTTTAP